MAVQQEKEGGAAGGAGAGVRVRGPAYGGQTRSLVLGRLASGASISDVSRDLGVHRSTVQGHRDALLAAGALVRLGQQHVKGPAFAVSLDGTRYAGPDRHPIDNATAPWLMTDGLRTFEILRGVQAVDQLAGFTGTKLSGRSPNPAKKRRNHRVSWTHDGRTFDMLLLEEPGAIGHGWSLQLRKVRPAPPLAAVAQPGEDTETAWDRFTLAAVSTWAALPPGVAVNPDLSRVRRSRPVSLALGGVMDPDVKFRGKDADADETPAKGTLEVRTAQLKASVEHLPEFEASTGSQLQELSVWRRQVSNEVADVRAVSLELVGVLRTHAEAFVAIAKSEAASLPLLPKRGGLDAAVPLPRDSGVDVT